MGTRRGKERSAPQWQPQQPQWLQQPQPPQQQYLQQQPPQPQYQYQHQQPPQQQYQPQQPPSDDSSSEAESVRSALRILILFGCLRACLARPQQQSLETNANLVKKWFCDTSRGMVVVFFLEKTRIPREVLQNHLLAKLTCVFLR
jgi:hypothetical protein